MTTPKLAPCRAAILELIAEGIRDRMDIDTTADHWAQGVLDALEAAGLRVGREIVEVEPGSIPDGIGARDPTPEEIARGVSRAERHFLLNFNPGPGWAAAPMDGWRRSQRGRALCRKGLLTARFESANGLHWYMWTTLGRAVAETLRKEKPE